MSGRRRAAATLAAGATLLALAWGLGPRWIVELEGWLSAQQPRL